MIANNIIDEVKAAAAATSEVSHFPVNVVEAHTLRGNIPKFDVTPCICIGIKSFVYGELLTAAAASGEFRQSVPVREVRYKERIGAKRIEDGFL